jgi:hypothetical protein
VNKTFVVIVLLIPKLFFLFFRFGVATEKIETIFPLFLLHLSHIIFTTQLNTNTQESIYFFLWNFPTFSWPDSATSEPAPGKCTRVFSVFYGSAHETIITYLHFWKSQ